MIPGPYRTKGNSILAIDHGREFVIGRAESRKLTAEGLAGVARLFAASYDLLERLERLTEAVEEGSSSVSEHAHAARCLLASIGA